MTHWNTRGGEDCSESGKSTAFFPESSKLAVNPFFLRACGIVEKLRSAQQSCTAGQERTYGGIVADMFCGVGKLYEAVFRSEGNHFCGVEISTFIGFLQCFVIRKQESILEFRTDGVNDQPLP